MSNPIWILVPWAVFAVGTGINATELSAYCRERGLYPKQLERWRQGTEECHKNIIKEYHTALQAKNMHYY